MIAERMHISALVLFMAGSAGAQSLDLGPVERPEINTGNALSVHFMAELEVSASDGERALVRLAAALARTGDARDELVARTIDRHLDALRGVLREARAIHEDPDADRVRRQRMRELLARIDRIAVDLDASTSAQLRGLTERLLGAVAQLAAEVAETGVVLPARLEPGGFGAPVEVGDLTSRLDQLGDPFQPYVDRLKALVELLASIRSVPSLESSAASGLNAIASVVGFSELPGDSYVIRAGLNRFPETLERCLFNDGTARSPSEASAMLVVLSRVSAIIERCGLLEGDTARRIEPVLGRLLGRLRSPEDAELIELVLLPIERSTGLIVRGARLPAPSAVSAQLQYAWRFLLPQEQAARIAAIEAVGRISTDPERVASPDVVSALIGHAELVESLEALLGVDALQQELEASALPGATDALDALRGDLRQMGDRRGYRRAGDRVLPIVRTLARYRALPGAEVVRVAREDEPDWAAALREQVANEIGPLRVRLAVQLISEAAGGTVREDQERLDARHSLETLRRTVLLASDLLTLDAQAQEAIGALAQFEWFAGEGAVGLSAVVGLDRAGAAVSESVRALAANDAQRAAVVLDGVTAESTMIGVLAEFARRISGGENEDASGAALEAALAFQRLDALGEAAPAIVEFSLTGRYRADGLNRSALQRYAFDQAQRAIDELDWLREVWQRRR